jgi:hypothetical protein
MGKVLVLLGALTTSVAFVGTAMANHSWGSYHWARAANPLTLQVGDNVSSGWDAHLDRAVSDWNSPLGGYTKVLQLNKATGMAGASCSPSTGRIEVCNSTYGNTGWLGIAQIWASGSHITQGVAKMNDTYFNTATYNTPEWRQLVMCQEVAHDFGLDHQDENFNNANLGSCMDYTNDPDGPLSNLQPNVHDFEQLALIYAHLDGSSGGGKPCRGKKCPNPAALDNAPPFSQASRANGSVYVDHLANGGRKITHVFWTPSGE